MKLSDNRINEIFIEIDRIKHRITRVIGNIEKRRARYEIEERKDEEELLLAAANLLNIVELMYKENNK